jgi:hypothetical protein
MNWSSENPHKTHTVHISWCLFVPVSDYIHVSMSTVHCVLTLLSLQFSVFLILNLLYSVSRQISMHAAQYVWIPDHAYSTVCIDISLWRSEVHFPDAFVGLEYSVTRCITMPIMHCVWILCAKRMMRLGVSWYIYSSVFWTLLHAQSSVYGHLSVCP